MNAVSLMDVAKSGIMAQAELKAMLAEHGKDELCASCLFVLRALAGASRPLTIGAVETMVPVVRAQYQITKLMGLGYVSDILRQRTDKRFRTIEITEKGRELLAQLGLCE